MSDTIKHPDTRSPRARQADEAPTRAQVMAAQLLIRREAKGLGKVSDRVRRIARMTPVD